MSAKKTYIYRMLIGKNGKINQDFFMYARNAKVAIAYCQEVYHDKHYDFHKAIKVGISHTLKETSFISDFEANQLINAGAKRSDFYSERNMEPQGLSEVNNVRSDTAEDLSGSNTEPDE